MILFDENKNSNTHLLIIVCLSVWHINLLFVFYGCFKKRDDATHVAHNEALHKGGVLGGRRAGKRRLGSRSGVVGRFSLKTDSPSKGSWY